MKISNKVFMWLGAAGWAYFFGKSYADTFIGNIEQWFSRFK